jgi:hypothetical protein
MPAESEKYLTFFAFITAWAFLIDIFWRDIPSPYNLYAVYVTSGAFAFFMFCFYLEERS